MRTRRSDLMQLLRSRLAELGISFATLGCAREIVVFGSCAAGLARPDSDLDILIVGPTRNIRRSGLDLIALGTSDVGRKKWLTSELASHVAAYGIWLRGRGDWKKRTRLTERSVRQKTQRVKRRIYALKANWNDLHPIFQDSCRRGVRRDLQRLALLRQREAIPATAILDTRWEQSSKHREDIAKIAESLKVDSRCFHECVGMTQDRPLPSRRTRV